MLAAYDELLAALDELSAAKTKVVAELRCQRIEEPDTKELGESRRRRIQAEAKTLELRKVLEARQSHPHPRCMQAICNRTSIGNCNTESRTQLALTCNKQANPLWRPSERQSASLTLSTGHSSPAVHTTMMGL